MKSLVINYKLFSNKINDKNILVLSDIYNYQFGSKSDLADTIINNSPDLIVIAGDILRPGDYNKYSLSHIKLKNFLYSISESSPVVLGLGDRDLRNATKETIKGYKDLENVRPGFVFPLVNESVVLKDMRITEFHPRYSAFSRGLQDSGNALLKFCGNYEKSKIEIPEDNLYNLLICHNPKFYVQARSIAEQLKFEIPEDQMNRLISLSKKMSKYDLVVSGHNLNGNRLLSSIIKNPSKYMDEGYIKTPIERNANDDISKIRPWIYKKSDLNRGTIFVGEKEERIIQLCDGSYFYKKGKEDFPLEVTEDYALRKITSTKMKPVVISGGVNRFYNIPIDHPEVTQVKVLKK